MIQMTHRERMLSLSLIVALAVSGLYTLMVRPARERVRTLQRLIPEKQAQLRDLQTRSAQYTALRHDFTRLRESLAAQEPDFELLPFLETKIERHRLTRHLVTMEPNILQLQPDYSEVVVTIELRDISLQQLIGFLSEIDTAESLVRVGSLHIRRNPSPEGLLDSTVGIFSPKLSRPALAARASS